MSFPSARRNLLLEEVTTSREMNWLGSARPASHPPPQLAQQSPMPNGARQFVARYSLLARAADVVAAALSAVLAVLLRFGNIPDSYLLLPFALPLAWLAIASFVGAYEHRFVGEGPEEYRRTMRTGLLLFAAVAVISYAFDGDFSRTIALIAVPCTVAGSLIARQTLRSWLWRSRKAGLGLHRVLVVGHVEAVANLIDSLRVTERSQHHGLLPVGVCLPAAEVNPSQVDGVPVVGTLDDILTALTVCDSDLVAIVSHPDLAGHALRRLSWALEERGVEMLVSPGIVEVAGPRLSIRPVAGLSLLHLAQPTLSGGRRVLKRAFDYTLAMLMIILMLPVLLGIAALIRLTSRGPALFRQTRVGTRGREFVVYKFRSMIMDAEAHLAELTAQDDGNGVLFKMRADPRVTPIGRLLRRFSLDELPQLINVLRGNMSLVGPRPPLPAEVAGYTADEIRRLRVRPGLTGLWQVSGRSDLTWDESLRLDLRYVDNWSLALDLQILWRTIRAVTHGSGAY